MLKAKLRAWVGPGLAPNSYSAEAAAENALRGVRGTVTWAGNGGLARYRSARRAALTFRVGHPALALGTSFFL